MKTEQATERLVNLNDDGVSELWDTIDRDMMPGIRNRTTEVLYSRETCNMIGVNYTKPNGRDVRRAQVYLAMLEGLIE